MSEESFAQMLDNEEWKEIRTGEVVDGRVIAVKPDRIVLNIGGKSDGIITRSEYTSAPDVDLTTVVSVGDEMKAKVLKSNDGEGQVALTYRKLVADNGNKKLEDAFNNQEPITGVAKNIKGGLEVIVDEARVFIPASLISDTFVKDLSVYNGKEVTFVITEYDPKNRKIIGDCKQLIVAAKKAAAEEAAKKAQEEANKKAADEAAKKAAEASKKSSSTSGSNTAASSGSSTSSKNNTSGSSSSAATSKDNGSSSSSSSGSSGSSVSYNPTGQSVVNYACQFVGNPYVWGGTSLTNGADCSGFIMSIYAKFGVSLPHSSGAMAGCGRGVSYSEAMPGDIICYAGHVAIYMGGGQIVHASNAKDGIKISGNAAYRPIVAVRRVL